jgi:hypothetical protein
MFKVLVAMEEVFRTDSLVEACHMFIRKVQEMIRNGGCPEYVLYETCMIDGEVDGIKGIMNFTAISLFSHGVGLLNERGHLSEKPLPFIPKDFAKQIFLQNNKESQEAFLAEQKEHMRYMVLCNLAEATMEPQPKEPEKSRIVLAAI